LAIPPDHLHEVTPAATEDEEMPSERALLQHALGLRRQRRKPLAHLWTPPGLQGIPELISGRLAAIYPASDCSAGLAAGHHEIR
jgi:hypothetical protein